MSEPRHAVTRYLPRCRTCGPLGPLQPLERAITACRTHRMEKPSHNTQWIPLKISIQVKGQPS